MEKTTIETTRFKTADELDFFIVAVQSMRDAQREYRLIQVKEELQALRNEGSEVEDCEQTIWKNQHVSKEAKDLKLFERQVDNILKKIPPVTCIFL